MIFHFDKNFDEKDRDLFKKAQEDDLKKICSYLQTDEKLLEKVRFEVFSTREGKQNADPNHSISRASARFEEMAIYRFWLPPEDPHFPHETTHLVAHTWTDPYLLKDELDTWDGKKITKTIEMVSTSFFQEGLAIAVDDIVFGRKLPEEGETKFIDDWCRDQIDKIPQLSQCINMEGFDSFENKLVVPFTASFSKYLLESFGVEIYKKMYISISETTSIKENINEIEKIYNMSENSLLQNWKSSLLSK